MSWANLIQNTEGFSSVYGGRLPNLTAVQLHEIIVHRDGPTASVRMDIPEFPANPPAKWARLGYNTIQLTIECIDVKNVSLEGFSRDPVGDIAINKSQRMSLAFISPHIRFEVECEFISISTFSAYANEE